MGRIRILSDQVSNQIAAGEVVDRPASVVKELLENSIDASATRIRVEVEGGGRKLIRVADDGFGMNRDDALLAFERHATSKLRTADDLLSISTLGFRGEALPSIASVARVTLETASGEDATGTRIEIAGGKMLHVDDAALPRGTTLAVADLFFNTPARRKFLRAESTELAHIAALVTHYALAHPDKYFELVSASHTVLSAPPVARTAERIYQIFGKDTLAQLLPVAAETPLDRSGLPDAPPWRRDPEAAPRNPGTLRLSGFYSKPELQKLNRNSIYIFVNKRLIRDRLLLHAVTEAYRNVIPPTSFPVALVFLEMPPEEVDVNVHPSKTEVRFRQQTLVHDFVRDSLRTALVKARPAAGFLAAIDSHPSASPSLMPAATSPIPGPPDTTALQPPASPPHPFAPSGPGNGLSSSASAFPPDSDPAAFVGNLSDAEPFRLTPAAPVPVSEKLPFDLTDTADGQPTGPLHVASPAFTHYPWSLASQTIPSMGETARALFDRATVPASADCSPTLNGESTDSTGPAAEAALIQAEQASASLNRLASLKPLGQLRESFILAAGDDGLWIIDQHVAHERVLFEKILRARQVERVQRQRLLMPMLIELKPEQMIVFARIARELESNGFEVEPFGPQTLAVKAAPVSLEGQALERTLSEVIEQSSADSDEPAHNEELTRLRTRIAASIACHAAIKINTALDPKRIEWLLLELAKTSHPTSCPHGRPIALVYSWKEIQRAFHRI